MGILTRGGNSPTILRKSDLSQQVIYVFYGIFNPGQAVGGNGNRSTCECTMGLSLRAFPNTWVICATHVRVLAQWYEVLTAELHLSL